MFIHAASGEFVTNAKSTSDPANRRALEYMNNGGTISGYANGGLVRPQYVQPSYGQQQYSQSSSIDQSTRVVVQGNVGYDPESFVREIAREKRKANASAGIGRVTVA
jgi:hypothetical protein